jgi:uncharacterized membrane protein
MNAAQTGPTTAGERLERIIGVVLRAGVTISSVSLAAGLVLEMLGGPAAAAAAAPLHVGIIVLLATPVARVIVSIVQYANERDWAFVALTSIVLVELMASAVAALVFNKHL